MIITCVLYVCQFIAVCIQTPLQSSQFPQRISPSAVQINENLYTNTKKEKKKTTLKGFNKGIKKKRSFKWGKESKCHRRITFDFSLQNHLLVFEIWIFLQQLSAVFTLHNLLGYEGALFLWMASKLLFFRQLKCEVHVQPEVKHRFWNPSYIWEFISKQLKADCWWWFQHQYINSFLL